MRRRRRTEATATLRACQRVGTSAGWGRACGCGAANVGGVARGGDGVCLLGVSPRLCCQVQDTEEEIRRPDQADGRDAMGWEWTRSSRLEALQEEENEQQIQRGAQEKR